MPSTSVKTNVMPDGGAVEAVYDAGDFGDHWPSQMQISTSVQLSSRAVEMRVLPVVGTEYDFTARTGSALPALDLDDTFVQLRQALLDNGPVAELRDPGNNYGLRLTLLSSSIKAIHVTAPANGGFVTITPQFNYDDPFGREWPRDEDTGMVVLQPGRSATWRIRLEIFSLTTNSDDKL
jgi:hypothetical protein